MRVSQRGDRRGREHPANRIGQFVEVERRVNLRGRQDTHQGVPATKLPD
jgi:hypothetical protein